MEKQIRIIWVLIIILFIVVFGIIGYLLKGDAVEKIKTGFDAQLQQNINTESEVSTSGAEGDEEAFVAPQNPVLEIEIIDPLAGSGVDATPFNLEEETIIEELEQEESSLEQQPVIPTEIDDNGEPFIPDPDTN